MIRRFLVVLAAVTCLWAPSLDAKGGGSKGSHTKSSSSGTHKSHTKSTAPRDSHGRIKRSAAAKHQFEVESGYPHGRPGYVVDHKVPLACGGVDAPSNMQWQTIADAKAKDRIERHGC